MLMPTNCLAAEIEMLTIGLSNYYQRELSDLGATIIQQGKGFGELDNDTELSADKKLGEHAEKLLRKATRLNLNRIIIEGRKPIILREGIEGNVACVDPLDGSLNMMFRGEGRLHPLPFSICITIHRDRGDQTTFGDIIAAGVRDLRKNISSPALIAEKIEGDDGEDTYITYCGRESITTNFPYDKLDITKMILLTECYYPQNRELVFEIFEGQKGWLRNPGSAAFEMGQVATGQVSGFFCCMQKLHEAGAAAALVSGAGGFVSHFSGKPVWETPYKFNRQTDLLLAANEGIGQDLLKLIRDSGGVELVEQLRSKDGSKMVW